MGANRTGKSSLINRLVDKEVATVGTASKPTEHRLVEKHECTINSQQVLIYDSRGFGDPTVEEQKIAESIRCEIETVDIVLICHKLYGRVDDSTGTLLAELSKGIT